MKKVQEWQISREHRVQNILAGHPHPSACDSSLMAQSGCPGLNIHGLSEAEDS